MEGETTKISNCKKFFKVHGKIERRTTTRSTKNKGGHVNLSQVKDYGRVVAFLLELRSAERRAGSGSGGERGVRGG